MLSGTLVCVRNWDGFSPAIFNGPTARRLFCLMIGARIVLISQNIETRVRECLAA